VTHIVILGGGPGGYVAAVRARQLGAEVTLVEMDRLGGVCLNRGCIPSKALLRSAEVARLSRELHQYGVESEFRAVNWPRVMQRKARVVGQLVKGVESLMQQHGVKVVTGRGRLAGGRAIVVDTGGREEIVLADKVVIATGSVPARLPLAGFEPPLVLTSDEVLELASIPESMAIIGGGAIGAEFAEIFSSAGCKITIIEMLPRIVPLEDEEVSAELARSFRRRRVEAFTSSRVTEVGARDGARFVRFIRDGQQQEVTSQVVVSAVGRWPNTGGIGLAEAGVELENRRVKVNARMETSAPGVYACGDAIGGYLLAHVASAEGKVAVANAVGHPCEMDYTAIPSGIYTHPEIGSVGLTEAQAQERGVDTKTGRFFYRACGKAIAEGEREGFVKLVVEAATHKIIGGHIIGPHATDLIHELVLAIKLGATAEQVGEMVHAHPTLSEPVMEAAEDVLGLAIHK
jgi:dihydrolipoamide dehydrogenase